MENFKHKSTHTLFSQSLSIDTIKIQVDILFVLVRVSWCYVNSPAMERNTHFDLANLMPCSDMLSLLTKCFWFSQKLRLIAVRLQSFSRVSVIRIFQTGVAKIYLIKLLKACILSVVIQINPSLAEFE